MSKWIDGVHHIALTPTVEQYDELVKFYTQLLGLEITRSWGDPQHPCLMISCGDNSCLEILPGDEAVSRGCALAHLAFATAKVDELIERVREAGYEIAYEPYDTDAIGAPIHIAFCYGPIGEYIEFFWEK